MVEQAKFTYSPLGKVLEKQKKKQLKTKEISNQNKRLLALTNKGDHKNNHKKIFEEFVKESFDEIKELSHEVDHNGLTYYFTGNTTRKKIP